MAFQSASSLAAAHHPVAASVAIATGGACDVAAPSKRSLKRKLREEKRELNRETFVAKRKEARKRRRLNTRTQREELAITGDDSSETQKVPPHRGPRRPEEQTPTGVNVVFDCNFDDFKMLANETKSLCKQLAYCYSVNRRAFSTVTMTCTGVSEQFGQILEQQFPGHLNWTGMKFRREHYTENILELPSQQPDNVESLVDKNARTATVPTAAELTATGPKEAQSDAETASAPVVATPKTGNVVYLTADSPNTLESLEAGKTYIIGGLVDHNRHKNACFLRAQAEGLAHAHLPIKEYIKLVSRRVLAVNHCFDIMVHYLQPNGGDWGAAFSACIPSRKVEGEKKEKIPVSEPAQIVYNSTAIAADGKD